MTQLTTKMALTALIGAGLVIGSIAEAAPKRGGVLNYVVGSKIPSYDGHKETTFGMIHPMRPFYSTLIRVNPDNPSSPTDSVVMFMKVTFLKGRGGTKFTLKIKTWFRDCTPATAMSEPDKIIFPPKGFKCAQGLFMAVESVNVDNDYQVTFKLKFPTGLYSSSPYRSTSSIRKI